MTYFSQNVIVPLERHFAKESNPLQIEATRIMKMLQRKWFKYVMVFLVGICLILNVAYIMRKFARRETKLTTTFDFANSTTRLPFPGLRLCIPQIFQLSRLSEQELVYLYRNKRAYHENYTHWMPPLESVVLHLSINGKSIKPRSVFVNRHDKFYKVCWQTNNHKFISRSPGTLQSIDMTLNLAEYEDIVHPKSTYLRHLEIGPFDQYTEIKSDSMNILYLSPGRHSLITLRTIKEDSTIRPLNSVACMNQVDHDICQQIVEQSHINKTCLGSNTPQNVSVELYVNCMSMSKDPHKICTSSCTKTIYKSFKSEAKLKFAKNLGNMHMSAEAVDEIKMRIHRSVALNSAYDFDYRKGIVARLPAFIKSTRTAHKMLSRRPVLTCSPNIPEVNFLSDFPNVRDQFNLFRTHSHVHISIGRKYWRYSEKHWHAGIKSYVDALSRNGGRNFYYTYYLSTGHSDNLVNVDNKWFLFMTQLARNLSVGYEMNARALDSIRAIYRIFTGLEVKSTILKSPSHGTNLIMMKEESNYLSDLDVSWNCHAGGGIWVPFTNDWAKTSRRYLLINDTRLFDEAKFGKVFLDHFYKRERLLNNARGVPVYIDSTKHDKVLVPKIVIYHCAFYKSISDIFEKQLGMDRQFSYTNINARYKVNSDYTLFVLNNILQTENRWGIRPSAEFDICEEESCACNIASLDQFLSPIYLPSNSTSDQTMQAAKQRTINNMLKSQLSKGMLLYKTSSKCGSHLYSLERRSVKFARYFEHKIIKQHDRSIEILMALAHSYETVRKGHRLREFGYLLRTYGLKRRIERLYTYLNGVMHGSSFEDLATFLDKKGKIMVGEVQLVLYHLSTAYTEYLDYFRRNMAAAQDAWLIMSLSPVTEDAFFLADVFNSTAETMLRKDIFKLPRLIKLMKKCMMHSHILLEQNYLPLHRTLMQWLDQVNYFIWRAKLYVDSKQISQSFMDSNIAVVSIFYETLDIRYETNNLRYSSSQYKSDWGNMLGLYYGLEAFSFLQLFTFIVSVVIRYYKKRHN